MKKNKVLVIGIDGGDFEVIRPLLEKGELPNIKALIDKGVCDVLNSSIHPSTEQAWASFMTGCNNGKHGIFGYTYKKKGSYDFGIVNGSFIKKKALWEILSDHGKKSIVINVPLTYPPRKINGILVSCFFAPDKNSDYTYPKEFKHEIDKVAPDYVLENVTPSVKAMKSKGVIDEFIKKVDSAIQNRGVLARHLLEKYEWDLFVIAFTCTDGIQHRFWHCIRSNSKYSNVVYDVYKKIDSEIGTFLSRIDEDTTVFLISDHGFCELKKRVVISDWLKKNGYLVTRSDFSHRLKLRLLDVLSSLIPYKLENKLKNRFKKNVMSSMNFSNVQWDKTKAYAVSSGNIYINLKGRDLKGCVDEKDYESIRLELIKGLEQIKDPDTGKPIIKPLRREDIYHGDLLQDAPDIINFPEDGYKTSLLKPSLLTKGDIFSETNDFGKGYHSYEGVFIASGNNIKKMKLPKSLNLIDITPTVLYLLGVPIPEHIDGRVIKEIIKSAPEGLKKKGYSNEEKGLLDNVISQMKDEF